MKKVLLALSCFVFLALLSPSPIFAADCRSTGCPTGETCEAVGIVWRCSGGGSLDNWHGCPAVSTALGPIPTEPECLVKWVLTYAILMGGGIAFLLSLWGGVTIILAAGNPEKINEGKEIISSALTGLFIIIFSVFLLRLIGFDILKLPDFS